MSCCVVLTLNTRASFPGPCPFIHNLGMPLPGETTRGFDHPSPLRLSWRQRLAALARLGTQGRWNAATFSMKRRSGRIKMAQRMTSQWLVIGDGSGVMDEVAEAIGVHVMKTSSC